MTMRTRTFRVLLAVLLGLAAAACGGDDTDDPGAADAEPSSDVSDDESGDADGDAAPSAGGSGTITLDGEELAVDRVGCFFEEQPRAGLGGVFTHTAQASFTTSDGTEAILDVSRARGEDGTVEDDVSVDIGDPFGGDVVSLDGGGPEGTLQFDADSASASQIELKNIEDFQAEPVLLSFELTC